MVKNSENSADYHGEYSGGPGRIQPRRHGGGERVVGSGNVPVQEAHVELTAAEQAAVERKANKYEANGVSDKSLEDVEAELRGEK